MGVPMRKSGKILVLGAAVAAVMSSGPAVASASSEMAVLQTQKCDDNHGIRVCITYLNGGFEGSVYNRSQKSINGLLTTTDQKTWKVPQTLTVAPGKLVSERKSNIPNGHACAGLYVPAGAYFPEWMACIN